MRRTLCGLVIAVASTLLLLGCGDSPPESGGVEPEDDWHEVALGSRHNCAIYTEGTLWCWGRGQFDLEEPNEYITLTTPKQFGTATGWVELSGSAGTRCGLRDDGSAWCWGGNTNGRLGDGTYQDSAAPVQVESDQEWKQVEMGWSHACGIKADGTLWCWGDDERGKVGQGPVESTTYNTPQQVGSESDWIELSVTGSTNCAIREDQSLWCWGHNHEGRLGQGSTNYQDTSESPAHVDADPGWVDVSLGTHACAIRDDGTLWCWGNNYGGMLGDGTTENQPSPVQVGSDSDWAQVAAASHTCGIRQDGSLWCWGNNEWGQIGTGSDEERYLEPTRVDSEHRFRSVSVSDRGTCAVTVQQTLYCWGANSSGRFGDGTEEDHNSPTPVVEPS